MQMGFANKQNRQKLSFTIVCESHSKTLVFTKTLTIRLFEAGFKQCVFIRITEAFMALEMQITKLMLQRIMKEDPSSSATLPHWHQ